MPKSIGIERMTVIPEAVFRYAYGAASLGVFSSQASQPNCQFIKKHVLILGVYKDATIEGCLLIGNSFRYIASHEFVCIAERFAMLLDWIISFSHFVLQKIHTPCLLQCKIFIFSSYKSWIFISKTFFPTLEYQMVVPLCCFLWCLK